MMSPKMIENRKRWIILGLQQRPHKSPSYQPPRRGYVNGDIRCVNCKKWIDPIGDRFPSEAKEIIYSKGKKQQMIHSPEYCHVNSDYVASFSTTPKFHGTRKKWLEAVHRY